MPRAGCSFRVALKTGFADKIQENRMLHPHYYSPINRKRLPNDNLFLLLKYY